MIRAAERAFDAAFGARANPLRQLGALGFWLLWIVVASGAYVYVFYETSVGGAWNSLDALARRQPWAGGLMRSLHRYASDALLLVTLVHVLREFLHGRYTGFRWFTWVSGVPLPWLLLACGAIGYLMVWDETALWAAVAFFEWIGGDAVRNVVVADLLGDRFFSLLAFAHIALPLLVLAGLWAHLLRVSRPQTVPTRPLAAGTLAALFTLAVVQPAASMPAADLARLPEAVAVDWFYLGVLPWAQHAPLVSALALGGATVLAAALPWLVRRPVAAPAPAVVDPAHCNGCGHCLADCPYAAITLVPHANGRAHLRMAAVDADRCAACGVCVGACPSATPLRRGASATGIDLPGEPLAAHRRALDAALERLAAQPAPRVLVLGCTNAAQLPAERGAMLGAGSAAGVVDAGCAAAMVDAGCAAVMVSAGCAAQWPPSFVEYALRRGVDGVLLAGCPGGDAAFRDGTQIAGARIDAGRAPALRAHVDRQRVRLHRAGREDAASLARALTEFRAALEPSLESSHA